MGTLAVGTKTLHAGIKKVPQWSHIVGSTYTIVKNEVWCLKKNLNASRPSEHPLVRGENVKTFRWDHRLQKQNLFMVFKRVPQW